MTSADTTTPKERRPGWLAAFAAANPVVVVSSLGAFAYFVTRSAQTSFYSKFGLDPEDVGLGYSETLSRATPMLLLLAFFAGLYTLAMWDRRYRRPGERHMVTQDRQRMRISPLTLYAVQSTVVTLLLLALWMPLTYLLKANQVRDGKGLRPPGLSTPNRFVTNPLGLRVEPVDVSWIDDERAAYDFSRNEVMYLGRAGGIAVFFDPRKRQTVRVPESGLVIKRRN